ncbi:MAG: hypothetical protein U0174_14195 [Polyangiaceae bacterium]
MALFATLSFACGGRLLSSMDTGRIASDGSEAGADTPRSPGAKPVADAGRDVVTRDVVVPDGGTVYCGMTFPACPLSEPCCQIYESVTLIAQSCTSFCNGAAGQSAIAYACDGPEDCTNGDICCSYRAGGSGCDRSESCDLNTDHLQLCHRDSDCAPLAGTRCCEDRNSGPGAPGSCLQNCP